MFSRHIFGQKPLNLFMEKKKHLIGQGRDARSSSRLANEELGYRFSLLTFDF